MRHFLTLSDWTPEEIDGLLRLAAEVKAEPRRYRDALPGRALGLIFLKASTRTRVSFEVGIQQLGGFGLFLSSSDTQLGRGEPIADTARVLSRYVDIVMARLYAQSDLEELARYADVPVINGLTDAYHPCQAMADLMTIRECFAELRGRKLAYVGDGNNMAHSLVLGAALTGLDVAVASPDGYQVDDDVVRRAREIAASTGTDITLTDDPAAAVRSASAVYTDVWTSMGQEAENAARLAAFSGYTVDAELMGLAAPEAIFLHCLPCHRGEEVAAEVADGRQSRIFDQAENRLHAQKAIMLRLMSAA